MPKFFKISLMEFKRTVLNKTFILLTVCGPLLITALAILPGFLSSVSAGADVQYRIIGISGFDADMVNRIRAPLEKKRILLQEVQNSERSIPFLLEHSSLDGFLDSVGEGETRNVTYTSAHYNDYTMLGVLQGIIIPEIKMQSLRSSGLTEVQSARLLDGMSIVMRQITNDGELVLSPDYSMILTTGLFFSALLYFTIIFYGQVIGRSVLMEKTAKTVEILLSSVRASDILAGKIIGNAFASILQYGLWIAISFGMLNWLGPRYNVHPGRGLFLDSIFFLVLFFILAYLLYSSIYAAIGSACTDEQQLTQVSLPVVVLLVIPVMLITQIVASPTSGVVVFLSFFPFTAPIVMFLRILLRAASIFEIILSVGLLFIATICSVYISTRIFTSRIIMNAKHHVVSD